MNTRRGKFGRRDRERGSAVKPRAAGAASVKAVGSGAHARAASQCSRAAGGAIEALRRPTSAAHPARQVPALRAGAVVEGTVSANRAGYGFVRVEGMTDSVFLPPREMRGVMHGDRVRVR